MSNTLQAIILAGGLGKRMSKDKAKVLHHIRNRPMIFYVIENALAIGASRIFIVVGKYHQQILNEIKPSPTTANFNIFVISTSVLGQPGQSWLGQAKPGLV